MAGNMRITKAIQNHLAKNGPSYDTDIYDTLSEHYYYVELSRVRFLLYHRPELFEKVGEKNNQGEMRRRKSLWKLKDA